MSQIISFSVNNEFADDLQRLILESGYKNRSLFLRDAALHYHDLSRRGDLSKMADDEPVEGTMVVYYQHGVENKLMELRHSDSITVKSYHHNCLPESHTCVDTMLLNGKALIIRTIVESLKNTRDIDRVEFIAAPLRTEGCC